METIELFMLSAFLFTVSVTFWKLYLIFPSTPLADDDTTEEAVETLTGLMLDALIESHEAGEAVNAKVLLARMKQHRRFDPERFWRLNENRVNQLLRRCYLREGVTSLHALYTLETERRKAL